MNIEKRIIAFIELGNILRKSDDLCSESVFFKAMDEATKHNGWFTKETILFALNSLGEMLREEKIRKWLTAYPNFGYQESGIRKIGVIMAGNIPLVGFHDFLCVLMSGNIFVGKLSSDDEFLLPAVSKLLIGMEKGFKDKIIFVSANSPFKDGADAFIATGSNNSARYFEYYFKNKPHIIRKNRNSVAILDGKESEADLKNLGKDIFQYFGLGCRNVSKIYVPENYDLDKFFAAIVDYGDVIHHNKYFNNYNYCRSIYLLNKEKFFDNNFLLVKEESKIASSVATLHYERYKSERELIEKLQSVAGQLQCIVSSDKLLSERMDLGCAVVNFGQTQSPELWDYPDGVDTMKFLLELK